MVPARPASDRRNVRGYKVAPGAAPVDRAASFSLSAKLGINYGW
jgi:hypothetical protein